MPSSLAMPFLRVRGLSEVTYLHTRAARGMHGAFTASPFSRHAEGGQQGAHAGWDHCLGACLGASLEKKRESKKTTRAVKAPPT